MTRDSAAATVRVRARDSLLHSGVFGAVAAGIPLFAVLYSLAVAQGSWLRVLVVQVIFMALFAALVLRHLGAFVEVTATTITKQTLFVRTVVKRSDVASLHMADTYHTSSEDLVPQMFALDAAGKRLLRMRGTFWARENMLAVCAAIGAPLVIEPRPLTTKEFYALAPGIAYWYEGRAWVAAAGIVVALGVGYIAVGWLLTAIGTPGILSPAL